MKSVLFFLAFCLQTIQIFSQSQPGKITGSVTGADQKGIEAATVQLLRETDQSLVKVAVTGTDGKYEFEKVDSGKYLLSITAVGFTKKLSNRIAIGTDGITVTFPGIQLEKAGNDLKEVTVTAKKPMVENKIDKTVVNVEAFITNAGGTALDVLEKSPGVTVDRDGNIGLKGKQGVIVLIDGKHNID